MRILRAVTLGSARGSYGGPWTTASRQAELLTTAGLEVGLLFGYLCGDKPKQEDWHRGAPVRRWVPVGRFSGLFSFRFAVTAFTEVRRADLVHVSLARDLSMLYVTMVALLLRKRLVVQPHGMLSRTRGKFARVVDPLIAITLDRAEIVISLTSVEAAELRSTHQASFKTVLLGNSVPDDLLKVGRVENGEVLFLGRLHARKRVLLVPQIASEVRKMSKPISRVSFSIVGPDDGEGPEIDRLRTGDPLLFSREDPVPPTEVWDRLARSEYFLMCSDSEPWGNVLAAALAMGKVCLVSSSTALAKNLAQHGAAVIIEDETNPGAYAREIVRLENDDSEKREIGRRARRFAGEYLVDSELGDQYRRLMLSLVNEMGGRL